MSSLLSILLFPIGAMSCSTSLKWTIYKRCVGDRHCESERKNGFYRLTRFLQYCSSLQHWRTWSCLGMECFLCELLIAVLNSRNVSLCIELRHTALCASCACSHSCIVFLDVYARILRTIVSCIGGATAAKDFMYKKDGALFTEKKVRLKCVSLSLFFCVCVCHLPFLLDVYKFIFGFRLCSTNRNYDVQ